MLLERAVEVLHAGPASTAELASRVLGLTGHPGAAASAVFALLGADPRFQVDGNGVWSLRVGPGSAARLEQLEYAVVDVETTGGSAARGHRITEVAVIELSGGEVLGAYRTLVNPGRPIPRWVTRLTGITDDMVRNAPPFEAIARDVYGRMAGRVFVAHNAAFDWRFVTAQLSVGLGAVPNAPVLCTVRMARRLLPELRRRNLDALAAHFGVEIHERHRAYGDALATARVFVKMLARARAVGIGSWGDLERLLSGRLSAPSTAGAR
ncbi:MAG: 3'-5' exonuclease [Gemmatimonadetes bacterium]|nr:3'-5' exonuclease [Gemmatimonadota bacterium]